MFQCETPVESEIHTDVRLALRAKNGDEAGAVYPIEQEKITVGAGHSCTLRLVEPGVRPLHCLITQGAQGWTVRRWADGTLLNGEVFTEATLGLGDSLTIGPVEMEVVSPEQPVTPEIEPTADAETDDLWSLPETELENDECKDGSESFAGAAELVEEKNSASTLSHHRRRARRLVRELRAAREENLLVATQVDELRSELERLQGEQAGLEAQRLALEEQLAEAEEQLEGLRRMHHEAEEHSVNQLAEAERQIAERDAVVKDLQAELEHQQRELEGVVAAAAAAQAAELKPAAEENPAANFLTVGAETSAEATPAASCEQATPETADSSLWEGTEAAESSLDDRPGDPTCFKEPTCWGESDRSEEDLFTVNEQCSSAADALDSHEEEAEEPALSAAQRAAAAEEAARLAATKLFAPPPRPQSGSGEPTTTSFIEQYRHLLDDDENEAQSVSASTAAVEGEPAVAFGTDPADDESIEDYMAGMMARLRGEEVPAPRPPVAAVVSQTSAAREANTDTPPPQETKEKPTPLKSLEELKVDPAPERSRDMSALRDLANCSAREAIEFASCRRARETAFSHLVLGSMGAGVSGYFVWASGGAVGSFLLGGLAGLAFTGYWCVRSMAYLMQSTGEATPASDASTEPHQPPAESATTGAEEEPAGTAATH